MKTDEKISRIRQWMDQNGMSAIIVPSDDPHKSEYVAEYWQARKWLTGFSGSAGVAVVTKDRAVLWTDFRYYIQAEKQLAGSGFELFKMGKPKVPSFRKWLSKNLAQGDVVGVDGRVFSRNDIKKIQKKLDKNKIKLNTGGSFIDALWTDRPARPDSQAFALSVAYAGRTRVQKLNKIREKMTEQGAQAHLVTTLDDIAWTLNLRGDDVHTNPVNIAYLLVLPQKAILFIPSSKVDLQLKEVLNRDGIELAEYESVDTCLSKLDSDISLLMDPENTSHSLFEAVRPDCTIIEQANPAIALKAVKNDVEIGHIRKTAVKDGTAVVNFLHWMETKGVHEPITEVSVAKSLYNFRKEQDLFMDNSFDPIMAFESHSAMCHYSATPETDVSIGPKGMFLTDSGGNYLTGTTDITRTLYLGDPSPQHKTDYTLVLKGHISVATAFFPEGTKGFQIDTLARQYLWNQGLNFGHGTGHGVGFFLCVHEGPARISPVFNDTALEKGMLLTNEPGVYREGYYGIRLENQILVDEAFENEFGKFLKFENVTFCHFERDLIDVAMLSDTEKEWVNRYHHEVFEKLSPHLQKEVCAWLKEKTAPI